MMRDPLAQGSGDAGYHEPAARHFRGLLDVDPQNLEARFDLAQISSTQERWGGARDEYRKILAESQEHFRADKALAKLETISSGPSVSAGGELFVAKSLSRDIDIDRDGVFAKAAYAALDHVELGATYGHQAFRFEDRGSINRRYFCFL